MSVSNDTYIHGKNIELHVLTNNTSGNTYASYQLNFNPHLTLTNFMEHPEMRNSKDDEWEMSLIKTTFWNSMENIMAVRNNNTIKFLIASVPYTITLPNGNYSLQAINDEINYFLSANGLSLNLLVFVSNIATSRVKAIVKQTIQIDFTDVANLGIATFLGFTGQNLNNTGGVNIMSVSGLNEPLMNSYGADGLLIEQIQVRCDLVNHRVYANRHNENEAKQSAILYEYGINSSPSTLQVERNDSGHYIKIKTNNSIPNIRFEITNQDGVLLPLNKEATIQVQLRRNMDVRIQKNAYTSGRSIVYNA